LSKEQPPFARGSGPVFALALALFVVGYGTNVSTPFLVRYKERLDLGDSATMLIFVVYVIGIMSTLLIAGPLSDRFGRRLCLPFILLSGFASLITIAGRDSFLLLLLARVLLGVVSGGALAIGTAWLQELMGRGNELRAALMTTVAAYGGFGFGPIASALYEHVGGKAPLVVPFVVHAGVAVVSAALLYPAPETKHRSHERPSFRPEFGVPAATRRFFVRIILPASIWVFAFPSTGFALFPLLISSAVPGFDVLVAGFAGTLTAWGGLMSRSIAARVGANRSLSVGLSIGVAGYLFGGIAIASGWWVVLLPGAVLVGAASATLTAGILTVFGEMAEDDSRGALSSTFYLLAYPGMTMPVIVTGLATFMSTGGALALVTTLAIATAVVVSRRVQTLPESGIEAPSITVTS